MAQWGKNKRYAVYSAEVHECSPPFIFSFTPFFSIGSAGRPRCSLPQNGLCRDAQAVFGDTGLYMAIFA